MVQVLTGIGIWTEPRQKPMPMNYLITCDPSGTHRDAAYFCTDGKMPLAEILGLMVWRWNLEVTFAELRGLLGMETWR